jgi:uncharacterized protein YsxB (DUF464 family)
VVVERSAVSSRFGNGNAKGSVRCILVDGHAGFAEYGSDIVCAAASAIMFTAAGALCEICGAGRSCATTKDGYFGLNVPDFSDKQIERDAWLIMETAYIGFRQIELSDPKNLTVEEKFI